MGSRPPPPSPEPCTPPCRGLWLGQSTHWCVVVLSLVAACSVALETWLAPLPYLGCWSSVPPTFMSLHCVVHPHSHQRLCMLFVVRVRAFGYHHSLPLPPSPSLPPSLPPSPSLPLPPPFGGCCACTQSQAAHPNASTASMGSLVSLSSADFAVSDSLTSGLVLGEGDGSMLFALDLAGAGLGAGGTLDGGSVDGMALSSAPWVAASVAPSRPPVADPSSPTERLALEWVHGFKWVPFCVCRCSAKCVCGSLCHCLVCV